ncbi:MAG: alpha/beta fold hydrolase [Planctomycetaceae bacterium]|nr:alpha/beta fold hydrolase [Planctomycetaceae bacterium]
MILLWFPLSLIAILLLADFCYQQYASRRIQKLIDGVQPFGSTTATSSDCTQKVAVPGPDGLVLRGCLNCTSQKNARGLILFLAELHGSHWTAMTYCQGLVVAGFHVLSVDFRNQGESDSIPGYVPIHWVSEYELDDVRHILEWISNNDQLNTLPLGLLGVSRGGAAALAAACRFPQIAAVVSDSGFTTLTLVNEFLNKFSRFVVPDWFFSRLPRWHIAETLRQALRRSERKRGCRYVHPEKEPESMKCPVLLISGRRDSYVTPRVTQRVSDLIGQIDCTWIVDKAKHNRPRSMDAEEYDRRVIEHFSNAFAAVRAVNGTDE